MAKPAKESKFAEESAAQSGPSTAMIALFQAPAAMDLTKAKRLNLPQLINPADVPIYSEENRAILSGKVLKISNGPSAQVDGKCLWLEIAPGVERLFPVVGSVRKALLPDSKRPAKGKERADWEVLAKELEKLYVGKTLAFKRVSDRFNAEFKRNSFTFEVFCLD